MVLYGIWLVDAPSGLLLSYVTVPGFNFNPDLFSGFITTAHKFAHEVSDGKLQTIALGNFKLLVQQNPILTEVLAVGTSDPEARYDHFFDILKLKAEPIVKSLQQKPGGFSAVSQKLRKELHDILVDELQRFATRNAPSDLSELTILREEPARVLLRTLLERQGTQLLPEPSITATAYSYTFAKTITSLSDEETITLLERLADFGLLLTEPIDTSLGCTNCGSLHLHPRILCPNCNSAAQPVELYEHLTCGYIGVRIKGEPLSCVNCGATVMGDEEVRLLRGYQCPRCNSSFKHPRMIFVCHSCQTSFEPEEAGVKPLLKYFLNPTLIDELSALLKGTPPVILQRSFTESEQPSGVIHRIKALFSSRPHPESSQEQTRPRETERPRKEFVQQLEEEEPLEKLVEGITDEPTSIIFEEQETTGVEVEGQVSSEPEIDQLTKKEPVHTISAEETAFQQELQLLEKALNSGDITEAEYDRRFVQLRLKLRQLRTQVGNNT